MINCEKIFEILTQKQHPKILHDAFDQEGFEIRFVGGCVRDAILGRTDIHDIDFATNAKPDQVQEIFKKYKIHYFDSGLKHGTITAVFEKTCYEITTLRVDQNCDGRHANIRFSESWEEDASRRDFTFNAFYMDFGGNFYDHFNGLDDLLSKRLKFIGSAFERINEDYLRILRAIRFFNRYCNCGFEEDSENSQAIKTLSFKLNLISGERISSEMIKIFEDSSSSKNLANLKYFNLLSITQFTFLENKRLQFEILDSAFKLNFLNHLTGISKIALVLKENSINPLKIKARWALSNKNFNILKKIFEFDFSTDFFDKPMKLVYLNFEILPEMIIIIFHEIYKNRILQDFCLNKIREAFKIDESSNDLIEFFSKILENLSRIQRPTLPIDSRFLMNLGFLGKEIGLTLKKFEKIWLEKNCEEMDLEEINRICLF
jgi:poly(A) polymerase